MIYKGSRGIVKRVPFIQQFYTTECGVCVITSLLNYYKSYHSIKDVRAVLEPGRDGTSLKQLINALRKYNFEASAFKVKVLDEKSNIKLPAIITWEDKHYVILERLTEKYVYLTDSEIGNLKIGYEEFNSKFSGVIIQVLPKDNFIKCKRDKNKILGVFKFLLCKYKSGFLIVSILFLLNYIVTIFTPLEMQKFIDRISSGVLPYKNLLVLIILVLLNSLTGYLKSCKTSIIGVCFDKEVNSSLIYKILHVPYIFFDRINNSGIFFALDNVTSIKNIFLNDIINIIFETVLVLIVLVYFLLTDIYIFIIVFIIMIPGILILYFFDEPIMRENRQMLLEYSNLKGYQVEVVNNILGIKSSSIEENIYMKWKEKYKKYYKTSKKYYVRYNAFTNLLFTMISLSPVIILVLSFLLTGRDSITIGYAVAYYSLSNLLFNSIFLSLTSLRNLRSDIMSVERLVDILEYKDQRDTSDRLKINLIGNIAIEDLYFRYSPYSRYVINGISLSLKSGEKIAIAGLSGSGKSTLIKLIAGIYEINSGSVYFDGINIDKLDMGYLKKQIAFISQNNYLLNKSIYDNIVLGIENVTEKDVYNACRIVNIHEEIMNLPMKYQTVVSEMGKNLSGGQCQRIILARIILLKPKMLLLDEATNALDKVNEKKILNYFYKTNCTIIMITHRLDLLEKCDKIIVMKDGEICEQGKYDELLQKGSYFNNLIK